MKKLLLITIILLIQSFPSFSEEKFYKCEIVEGRSSFFRVNKIKSTIKVSIRIDGKWEDWCDHKNSTMEILDRSVICNIKSHTSHRYERGKKKKIDVGSQKVILDFLTLTITNKTYGDEDEIYKCKVYDN